MKFVEEFWQDVKYGLHILRKNPGFTTVAVCSLALGIGANTAVFGLADILIFRPFLGREPNQLAVFISSTSYPDYLDYSDRNQVFTGLMAYRRLGFKLSSGQHNELVEGESVSAGYFAVLGLEFAVGRSFLREEDEAPGSHPVAILSHGLWQRGFGADPAIPGKTVKLNGESLTIVGVAPIRVQGRERQFFEVVGVVKDAKYRTLSEGPKSYAYFPLYQRYYSTSNLHVRLRGLRGPYWLRFGEKLRL